jgi:predicted MFS family arabinose efflux permease
LAIGSILGGPAAAYLKQMTGSWTSVFFIVAGLDILVAVLAITALKSMRARHIASS